MAETNGQDHDLLIKHDTILVRVEAKVDENAKESVRRDTELRIKLDAITDSCNGLAQGIRDIQTTERTNSADRQQQWEKIDILWRERAPQAFREEFIRQHQEMWTLHSPEEIARRKEHDEQHKSMWSAFTIFKALSVLFVIEQPVIISLVAIILARQ